jgi:transposase
VTPESWQGTKEVPMPWKEASPMDQRTQFIADHLRDTLSITELCELYSRKTGYKWIDRYLRRGPAALEERSRRPRRSPNATSEEIVAAILETRRRHPKLGRQEALGLAAQSLQLIPARRGVDQDHHSSKHVPRSGKPAWPAFLDALGTFLIDA